jgi:hypothetical protein
VWRQLLLVAGAILTLAGSLTIEITALLLLTPIPANSLAASVLVGIGIAGMGVLLLWLGRRLSDKKDGATD